MTTRAQQLLDDNRAGYLCATASDVIPAPFVIDGTTGEIILNIPSAMLAAQPFTLMIPEESDDALQLLLEPYEITESAQTDRWCAFHNRPEHSHWTAATVQSARLGEFVFDADALILTNPLAADEHSLCAQANSLTDDLRRALARCARIEADQPVCVGVDPRGIHLRLRFGVTRLTFHARAASHSEALSQIRALTER